MSPANTDANSLVPAGPSLTSRTADNVQEADDTRPSDRQARSRSKSVSNNGADDDARASRTKRVKTSRWELKVAGPSGGRGTSLVPEKSLGEGAEEKKGWRVVWLETAESVIPDFVDDLHAIQDEDDEFLKQALAPAGLNKNTAKRLERVRDYQGPKVKLSGTDRCTGCAAERYCWAPIPPQSVKRPARKCVKCDATACSLSTVSKHGDLLGVGLLDGLGEGLLQGLDDETG